MVVKTLYYITLLSDSMSIDEHFLFFCFIIEFEKRHDDMSQYLVYSHYTLSHYALLPLHPLPLCPPPSTPYFTIFPLCPPPIMPSSQYALSHNALFIFCPIMPSSDKVFYSLIRYCSCQYTMKNDSFNV